MEDTKRHKHRFNIWIRLIAIILTVTFLWQDIVWAYPDRLESRRSTLAQRTLATSEDRITSHEEFALGYIAKVAHNKDRVSHNLGAVKDEWWPVIHDSAARHGLREDELPKLFADDYLDGVVKMVFANGHEFTFYDPKSYDKSKEQSDKSKDRLYVDMPINDRLCLRYPAEKSSKDSTPLTDQVYIPEKSSIPAPPEVAKEVATPEPIDVKKADQSEAAPYSRAAIEAYKIERAWVLAPIFTAIVVCVLIFCYSSAFILLLTMGYFFTTSVLPILTAYYINKGLKYKGGRLGLLRRLNILLRTGSLAKATKVRIPYKLIWPLRKAKDIHIIQAYDDDAKKKVSYYRYAEGGKAKKLYGPKEGAAGLYVDKEAMGSIPRYIQWQIFLHEFLHGTVGIKTELAAVPLTFSGPWGIVGVGISILIWYQLLSGVTPTLSLQDILFMCFFTVYNLFIVPLAAKLLSAAIGVQKSLAGHDLLAPLRWRSLRDTEIDDAIREYAHRKTKKASTGSTGCVEEKRTMSNAYPAPGTLRISLLSRQDITRIKI